MVARHGAALLRVANQFSLCHDDALDAYQRGLEIYLRRLDTVDRATEGAWLRVVVKHEAMAIRRARQESVDRDDVDFDESVPAGLRAVEDVVAGGERVEPLGRGAARAQARRGARAAAEGRRALLPGDRQALRMVLHEGQRSITEGRKRFMNVFGEIESGEACETLRRGAERARRRHRHERAGGLDSPAPAPLRGLPRDRARDAVLARAPAGAVRPVRVARRGCSTAPGDLRRLHRRRAARPGGGGDRPVPERRRCRDLRHDGRDPGARR